MAWAVEGRIEGDIARLATSLEDGDVVFEFGGVVSKREMALQGDFTLPDDVCQTKRGVIEISKAE